MLTVLKKTQNERKKVFTSLDEMADPYHTVSPDWVYLRTDWLITSSGQKKDYSLIDIISVNILIFIGMKTIFSEPNSNSQHSSDVLWIYQRI